MLPPSRTKGDRSIDKPLVINAVAGAIVLGVVTLVLKGVYFLVVLNAKGSIQSEESSIVASLVIGAPFMFIIARWAATRALERGKPAFIAGVMVWCVYAAAEVLLRLVRSPASGDEEVANVWRKFQLLLFTVNLIAKGAAAGIGSIDLCVAPIKKGN
jgi:hypothetical protein